MVVVAYEVPQTRPEEVDYGRVHLDRRLQWRPLKKQGKLSSLNIAAVVCRELRYGLRHMPPPECVIAVACASS